MKNKRMMFTDLWAVENPVRATDEGCTSVWCTLMLHQNNPIQQLEAWRTRGLFPPTDRRWQRKWRRDRGSWEGQERIQEPLSGLSVITGNRFVVFTSTGTWAQRQQQNEPWQLACRLCYSQTYRVGQRWVFSLDLNRAALSWIMKLFYRQKSVKTQVCI